MKWPSALFGERFAGRRGPGIAARDPNIGDADVGEGAGGILLQGEPKVLKRGLELPARKMVPVRLALQISLEGLRIYGADAGKVG